MVMVLYNLQMEIITKEIFVMEYFRVWVNSNGKTDHIIKDNLEMEKRKVMVSGYLKN